MTRAPVDREARRDGVAVIFPGVGEMARRCRGMPWAATSLGDVARWPQSLEAAAGMVVSHGIAQNLW